MTRPLQQDSKDINLRSHFFPSLHAIKAQAAGQPKSECIFEPLYRNCKGVTEKGAGDGADAKDRTNIDRAKADREHWFQKGTMAGAQEARRVCRENLVPALDEFGRCLEEMKNSQQSVTCEAAAYIIQLALGISEQILCSSPELQPTDLAEWQESLQKAVCEAYRLDWRMHPDDQKELHAMTESRQIAWPGPQVLKIQSDATVSRGELNSEDTDRRRISLADAAADQLNALLAR